MYPYQAYQQQYPYQPMGATLPAWAQSPQPQQASDGLSNVRFVSGEVEARQCACPLGSRVLLMDASEPRFYVKETGFDNVSTVKAYEFHEVIDGEAEAESEFEKWRKQYEPIIRKAAGIDQPAAGSLGAEPDAALDDSGAGKGAGGAHLR